MRSDALGDLDVDDVTEKDNDAEYLPLVSSRPASGIFFYGFVANHRRAIVSSSAFLALFFFVCLLSIRACCSSIVGKSQDQAELLVLSQLPSAAAPQQLVCASNRSFCMDIRSGQDLNVAMGFHDARIELWRCASSNTNQWFLPRADGRVAWLAHPDLCLRRASNNALRLHRCDDGARSEIVTYPTGTQGLLRSGASSSLVVGAVDDKLGNGTSLSFVTSLGLEFVMKSGDLSTSKVGPGKIQVFFEALCPMCQQFIVEKLPFIAGLTLLGNPMRNAIELIPYGNAQLQTSDHDYKVTCQHGPRECEANAVLRCAISLLGALHSVPFVYCFVRELFLQSRGLPSFVGNLTALASHCAARNLWDISGDSHSYLPISTVDKCASAEGDFGNVTSASAVTSKAQISSVPAVVFNNQHIDASQLLPMIIHGEVSS